MAPSPYPKLLFSLPGSLDNYHAVLYPATLSEIGSEIVSDYDSEVTKSDNIEWTELTFTLGERLATFTHTFVVNRFAACAIRLGMDFLKRNKIKYNPSQKYIESPIFGRIFFSQVDYDYNLTIEAYIKFDGAKLSSYEEISPNWAPKAKSPIKEQTQKKITKNVSFLKKEAPEDSYDVSTQTFESYLAELLLDDIRESHHYVKRMKNKPENSSKGR